MSKPREKEIIAVQFGTRYKCYKCGTKFYDMGRPQSLCPSCGADQNNDESKGLHKRKRRGRPYPLVKADPIITAPEEGEDRIEVVNEVDAEYALDLDDIVAEGHEGIEMSE